MRNAKKPQTPPERAAFSFCVDASLMAGQLSALLCRTSEFRDVSLSGVVNEVLKISFESE
ncbi:hypothetical protein [Roseibium album]|uniref:hypothetical protein n=1 Tax=Roseibium album TaxID=311410 RepID=UPI00329A1D54